MKKIISIIMIIICFITQQSSAQNKIGNINYPFFEKSTSTMRMKLFQAKAPPEIKDKTFSQTLQFLQVEVRLNRVNTKGNMIYSTISNEPTPIIPIQDFEPNSSDSLWSVFDGDGDIFGEYYWGKIESDTCTSPTHSAWCAAAGGTANPDLRIYPNNCNSWLVCRPIDLSSANWAAVKFSAWLNSEQGHDYIFWMASTDSIHFYGQGMTGDSDGWRRLNFNLTNVPIIDDNNFAGRDSVWIAFFFFSDETSDADYEGAYLDDISIEAANLKTFEIVQKYEAPTSDGTGFTWNGNNFWYADWGIDKICQLNINTLDTVSSFPSPGDNPAGLAWDGNFLWNSDINQRIFRMKTSGDTIGNSILLSEKSPYGLTYDGNDLWASDYYKQSLCRLNPVTGRMESFSFPDDITAKFTGLAWDKPFLWLADESNYIIYKLDQSGLIHDYYLAPAPFPRGLTYDDHNLWCIANGSIFKLNTKDESQLTVEVGHVNTDSFPTIIAYLIVKDEDQNPIIKLTDKNFSVLEDGYDQTNIQISQMTYMRPMSYALVIDRSSSMDKEVNIIKQGARYFVNLMGPNDQGAIFQFDKFVHKYRGLTSDRSKLIKAIDSTFIRIHDGSVLFDATYEAIDTIKNENVPKAIIAMTDGNDKQVSTKTRNEVISWAMNNNIRIFCIGLGAELDSGEVNLIEISMKTGGKYYYAQNENRLDSICEEIFQEIAEEYQIVYESSKPIHDGSTRNVLIPVNYNALKGYGFFQYEAPSKDTITMWIDPMFVNTGDTVAVPVKIDNVTNQGIRSIFMEISYVTNVIKAVNQIKRGIVPDNWSLQQNISLSGITTIAAAGTDPLVAKNMEIDTLVEIFFRVTGIPDQSTKLQFDRAYFNEGSPHTETKPGLLKVIDGISLTGILGYYPEFNDSTAANFDSLFKYIEDFNAFFFDNVKKFIDNVKVDLRNQANYFTTITDSTGFYKFEKLFRKNIKLSPAKEDDLNDAITPYDASLVLQHVIGLKPFSAYQMIAADVTGNGSISTLDASYILRICTGDTNKFPVGADWTFIPHDCIINSTNWHRISRFRTYNPLDKSLDNQNFFGIVYGDVSGNWKDTQKLLVKNKIDDFLTSHLVADDIIEFSENRAKLTIGVKDVSDIYAFRLSLKYDPEVLKVINVSGTRLIEGFSLIYNAKDNIPPGLPSKGGIGSGSKGGTGTGYGLIYNTENKHLKIAAAGAEAIHGNGPLVNIELELAKSRNIRASNAISITSFSLNEFHATDLNWEIILNIVTALPTEYSMAQNYPNPFNLQTMIKYQLPEKASVKIEIFNLLGQRVKTLIDKPIEAGYHQVNWDGQDDFHHTVASGVYLCRFQANQFVSNRKMVILK